MRSAPFYTCGLLVLVLAACGGSQPPADEPETENTVEPPSDAEPPPKDDEAAEASEGDGSKASDAEAKPGRKEAPEPTFKENGTVDEAIAAVPPGTERLNIDQETLGKPLQDMALYEPCKPGSARIKFRVAVWNGKAVGLDLTATPKNPKLEECLKGRIRDLTWRDKVKALNTVEYQL